MNKEVSNAWMALALDVLSIFMFGIVLTLAATIICGVSLSKPNENHALCWVMLVVSIIMCAFGIFMVIK